MAVLIEKDLSIRERSNEQVDRCDGGGNDANEGTWAEVTKVWN